MKAFLVRILVIVDKLLQLLCCFSLFHLSYWPYNEFWRKKKWPSKLVTKACSSVYLSVYPSKATSFFMPSSIFFLPLSILFPILWFILLPFLYAIRLLRELSIFGRYLFSMKLMYGFDFIYFGWRWRNIFKFMLSATRIYCWKKTYVHSLINFYYYHNLFFQFRFLI